MGILQPPQKKMTQLTCSVSFIHGNAMLKDRARTPSPKSLAKRFHCSGGNAVFKGSVCGKQKWDEPFLRQEREQGEQELKSKGKLKKDWPPHPHDFNVGVKARPIFASFATHPATIRILFDNIEKRGCGGPCVVHAFILIFPHGFPHSRVPCLLATDESR